MAAITKYIRSPFPRSDIASVIQNIQGDLRVSIVYTDKSAGDYIREVIGEDTTVEQFRVAINGVEVAKPASIISPVELMLLFPAAARVAIRASTDPVIVDFLRMLDDPRLLTIDRNKPNVSSAIDYCVAGQNLTAQQIDLIKTGI